MAWMDSAEREQQLEKGRQYFTIDQRLQLTGLECWFYKVPVVISLFSFAFATALTHALICPAVTSAGHQPNLATLFVNLRNIVSEKKPA